MAFLKVIFVLILVYWLIKLLYRVFVPEHIRQILKTFGQINKQQQQQQQEQQQQGDGDTQQRPEGSVTLINQGQNQEISKNQADTSEYIDWEELDDSKNKQK